MSRTALWDGHLCGMPWIVDHKKKPETEGEMKPVWYKRCTVSLSFFSISYSFKFISSRTYKRIKQCFPASPPWAFLPFPSLQQRRPFPVPTLAANAALVLSIAANLSKLQARLQCKVSSVVYLALLLHSYWGHLLGMLDWLALPLLGSWAQLLALNKLLAAMETRSVGLSPLPATLSISSFEWRRRVTSSTMLQLFTVERKCF